MSWCETNRTIRFWNDSRNRFSHDTVVITIFDDNILVLASVMITSHATNFEITYIIQWIAGSPIK